MTYKYWEIEIDGPDKTGKDLLCKYLCEMSQYRFSINVRGLISQLVYTKKFNRDFGYDTSKFSKNKIIVLLTADSYDLLIRCKLTHEPPYDIEKDKALFEDAAKELSLKYKVLKYNTSQMTPYDIAASIINYINELEKEN